MVAAVPVRQADGEVSGAIVVVQDVTTQKAAEQALRLADRRKSEFLGVLSHELRNPLAPIRNSIYLLERAPPDSPAAAHSKEVIRRQTDHLTRLVDDLLDVTRISRGKIALQRARLDLRDVVRRSTDDLRSLELHGGAVRASSAGLGRGAEFVVLLPLAAEPPPAPQAEPEIRGRSRRVLIVEDNLDAARSLAEILELAGHQVAVAHDARSGLARAREDRPEVVICDIGLPDMDGYELARAMRRDEALRATRLIALTGYAQPEDVQRAVEAGFDAHEPKPASLLRLAALLAEDGASAAHGRR